MKTILTSHLIIWILVLPILGKAQLLTVTGNIQDSLSGKALENVSIFESFSKVGTISNQNGFFKLVLSQGEQNIKISNEGYIDFNKELVLTGDTILVVKLEPLIQNKSRSKKHTTVHADAKSRKKPWGYR